MESWGTPTKPGVLLVGHGTRDPEGAAEFLATARQIAGVRPEVAVEPCFLELAEPDICAGVSRLVDRGVEQLVVMPMLLFAAGHAKRDVPDAIASALQRWPQATWRQAAHLGCHAAIVRRSAEQFRDALVGRPFVPRERTALILVGRGSHDHSAIQEMHEFASIIPQTSQVGQFHVCFVAMANPTLEETLQHVADSLCQQLEELRSNSAELSQEVNFRMVVQPHLLFRGLLLDGIREAVARWAAKWPGSEWLICNHLGPNLSLVEAVWERIDAAGASMNRAGTRAQLPVATTLM